ncbi:MAG TPA: Holliday junction resolvase RuvX [Candidatus Saccharimonadales bacterium]|nr:Holliday junction resolvase RuvX [Candidatus Saccharimonadales bacterium]
MVDTKATMVALDIGDRRIGVAVASRVARLAAPLITVANDEQVMKRLGQILQQHHASAVVVGLPRGLDGQHTAQTTAVETFVTALRAHVDLPIYWQDEALSSKRAEAELNGRRAAYRKEDIDSLAASYILEDFLHDHFREPAVS